MKVSQSILMFMLLGNLLRGQTEVQMGLYPKGRFTFVSKRALPPDGGTELLYHFKPGILIRNGSNAAIFKYSHTIAWSDIGDLPLRRSFHLSYRRYFQKEFERYNWSKTITLFAEIESIVQDWAFDETGVVPIGKFNVWNFSPMLGFETFFLPKLKFEVAYGYRIFPKHGNHLDLFFGLMYKIK